MIKIFILENINGLLNELQKHTYLFNLLMINDKIYYFLFNFYYARFIDNEIDVLEVKTLQDYFMKYAGEDFIKGAFPVENNAEWNLIYKQYLNYFNHSTITMETGKNEN